MEKVICLRDDDTNYHTQIEDLELAYGQYWGNIPIMLACIPFVHGSAYKILECSGKNNKEKMESQREWEYTASAEELTEYHSVFPIGQNESLIKKLGEMQKIGVISIAQHGITHRYYEDGPEMLSHHYSKFQLRDGKEYLGKLFGKQPEIFIPPSNTVDYKSSQYLKDLGFTVCSGGRISYRNIVSRCFHMMSSPKDILEIFENKINGKYSTYRVRQGVPILGSVTFPSNCKAESYMEQLEKLLKNAKGVILTSHYQNLISDDNYRLQYHKLLEIISAEWEIISVDHYIKRVAE